MAADGTIVIDVTLDDGSVVQGLANINDEINNTANQGNKSFGKIGEGLKMVGVAAAAVSAAAVAGAVAIGGGAIAAALNVQEANNRIKASLGTTTEETEALTDTARNIYKKGFGESLSEVSDALIKVKQNMASLDDEELENVTTNAIALAKTFDGDVNEVTRAANNLMVNFGIDSEKAFDMMAVGAQNGLNFSGELFDNLAEYAPLWADMGYSAEEMFGILNRGADQGVYNFDYLNDVMKEFQIRSTDGSKSTVAAVKELGPAAQSVWKEFRNGEATVADLSQVAANELSKIDDKIKQNELGVALFGTKWEDLGGDVVLAMLESGQAISGFEGAMGGIVATQEEAFGQRWNALVRTTVDSLVPLGLMLLDIADSVMPKIQNAVEKLSAAFAEKMPAIKEVVTDVIENIKTKFDEVKAFWETSGQGILETVTNNFNAVKDVIMYIVDMIIPFVQQKLAEIVAFWEKDGEAILTAVTKAFEGVKNVIDFLMPAIKLVIEVIWGAIKNVITGALDVIMGAVKVFSGLFTGDFSKMWEGIKQVFSGAIDVILGLMSLSFIGGIRTAIVNFGKTAINLFKTNWTNIISGVKSFVTNFGSSIGGLVTNVIQFFRNMATNAANTIMQMSINVVGRITTMGTSMVNAIKGLPATFLQFGKDIVNGLIKGITGNVEKAVDAIKGVGSAIKDKFQDVMGIFSPSREFEQFGKWTVEGYQIGVEENAKMATGAIADLGKAIVNIGKNNAKEEQNIQKESNKKILEIQKDADAKINNLTKTKMVKKKKVIIDNSKAIAKIEADEAKKIANEQQKLEEKKLAVTADIQKQKLDLIKSYVEDKKSLEDLSINEEVKIWGSAVNTFKEGTKERIEAQKQYKTLTESIGKEIVSINEDYTKQMNDVDNKLIEDIKKVNEEYEKELSSRTSSYTNFKKLFDEFVVDLEISGGDLLANLQSQVTGFKTWQEQMDKFVSRGIASDELVEELRMLGPNSLSELTALNSLSDQALTTYAGLFEEKAKLAREQAEKELVGMKGDTQKRITEMTEEASKKLTTLQVEWGNKIKGVTEKTKTELSSLNQIGADAGQGLYDGLASKEGLLLQKAAEIAEGIKATIQSALDIHSPSRWMRDFVAGNLAKGFSVGVDKYSGTIIKASDKMGELIKMDVANPLRNATLGLGNISQSTSPYNYGTSSTTSNNNSRTINAPITIVDGSNDEQAISREMRKLQFMYGN